MNIKKRTEEEREIKSEKTSEQNLRKINDSLLHAKSNLPSCLSFLSTSIPLLPPLSLLYFCYIFLLCDYLFCFVLFWSILFCFVMFAALLSASLYRSLSVPVTAP